MRHSTFSPGLILLSSGLAAWAQAPAGAPAFDVASVRSVQGGPRFDDPLRKSVTSSPDSVIMRRATLRTCIAWAYKVMDSQVSGPDWLNTERYDISAKAAAPTTDDQLRIMAQTLLAERLKVEVHHQTKEVSAYVLSVAKNGPKFKVSEGDGDTAVSPDQARMSVGVQRGTMSQLVDVLFQFFHQPIIDQTGLKGKYDIQVDVGRYMADMQPPAGGVPPDPLALITTAIQEALGLKLESKKVALDLVVVDHAEKVPVEN